MSKMFTLYGAQMSLYTGKARAYLTYKKIPFREVFSSVKVYKSIIEPKTGVRFIPVVETPEGEFIQDTVHIIDELEKRFEAHSIYPATPKQQLVSEIFQLWGDEWLVIPAMHYRWNKNNFPFIYEEFGRVATPNMPAFVRRFFGKKLASRFKGFVPVLGITEKTIPAIEDWFENHVLVELNKHFSTHEFLLGSRPCAGDFGLFGPLYAHLYRDPVPGAILRERAPHVAKWVERLRNPPKNDGIWLEGDAIPDTLIPLLSRIFKEFWPVLMHSVESVQKWIVENPDVEKIPRSIGFHQFTIGGISEKRAIMPFQQWKLQRVVDVYNKFDVEQKANVDNFINASFGLKIEALPMSKRLQRKNNKLVVA
ncbi:glutathione S-transferase N-terminal domain-containing protein [Aliiglaciecola sp. 2_MG-2023]|uniref:glutathione S-transferase family protein n=1 Tax=unclassified Aliiglaciecola TaxID=2593648 RepID=UPI0026E3A56D|nr:MULTISPECIES: glutathione S-transferase N-terminal domain-containing protein [unclassified Aliiglaciecola]MDO6709090.1 glutathione S-transferase N-terminal domain-containing protein [Aliiglaciecola sp. 2_MG-2023]MDO6750238.1 glutathione S-transferase N-terminal domain-containing protein [Aliiglaciecola sp. 1_MG-2023]